MPKKEVSKNGKKEKKENKHFFKDFKAELKRVIWPTPKQLVNNILNEESNNSATKNNTVNE